jgi:hypothetical protein
VYGRAEEIAGGEEGKHEQLSRITKRRKADKDVYKRNDGGKEEVTKEDWVVGWWKVEW